LNGWIVGSQGFIETRKQVLGQTAVTTPLVHRTSASHEFELVCQPSLLDGIRSLPHHSLSVAPVLKITEEISVDTAPGSFIIILIQ
jgi:hypothetical protein